jgi:hypothetical protein
MVGPPSRFLPSIANLLAVQEVTVERAIERKAGLCELSLPSGAVNSRKARAEQEGSGL